MHHKYFLIFISLLLSGDLFGQIEIGDTLYYDQVWDRVEIPDSAEYYKTFIQSDSSSLKEMTYYMGSDKLRKEVNLSSINPIRKEGELLSYFENGNLSFTTFYVNDKETGPLTYYYENGEKQSEFILDPDDRTALGQRLPPRRCQNLFRIVRVDLLHEDILIVRVRRGQSPAQLVGTANQYRWRAGNGTADHAA